MKYDIKQIHLELSTLCNARCPMCARNFRGYPHNFGYQETNLTLEDCKKIFQPEFIMTIDELLINGNYGDFVMNPESVEIIEYFLSNNYSLRVVVSTNGGARDRDFWRRLGELKTTISFCIDGLEDTNHLYRQDVDFKTVIKNAKTFINAGGHAVWHLSIFDFNEKHLDKIEKFAYDSGFHTFLTRQTPRNRGPVFDRDGKKIHVIKEDTIDKPTQINSRLLDSESILYSTLDIKDSPPVKISCVAEKDKSIYVSADGHVSPCCWTGFSPATYRPNSEYNGLNRDLMSYIKCNHAPTYGLEKSLEWFDDLFDAWNTDRQPKVCQSFCKDRS